MYRLHYEDNLEGACPVHGGASSADGPLPNSEAYAPGGWSPTPLAFHFARPFRDIAAALIERDQPGDGSVTIGYGSRLFLL